MEEVLRRLVSASSSSDKPSALSAVIEREKKGSTAIGNEVAIPHAKTDSVKKLSIVLGIAPDGIDIDGETVRIFVLMLFPESAAESHVDLLSTIVQSLSSEKNRRRLILCPDDSVSAEVLFR